MRNLLFLAAWGVTNFILALMSSELTRLANAVEALK